MKCFLKDIKLSFPFPKICQLFFKEIYKKYKVIDFLQSNKFSLNFPIIATIRFLTLKTLSMQVIHKNNHIKPSILFSIIRGC